MSNNPFIHGTNFSTLCGMLHTDFALLDAFTLLKRGVGPLTGELTQGGWSTPAAIVHPCFGRVNHGDSDQSNYYDLPRVLRYTKPRICWTHNPSDIGTLIAESHKRSYGNIKEMLLIIGQAFAQSFQAGHAALTQVPPDFLQKANCVVQLYDILAHIGKDIHFDNRLYWSALKHTHYAAAARTFYTLDNLIAKLDTDSLRQWDFSKSCSETLNKITQLLTLPTSATLTLNWLVEPKNVIFESTTPFTDNLDPELVLKLDDTDVPLRNDPYYFCYRLSQNLASYDIQSFFESYAQGYYSRKFMDKFHKNVRRIRDGLRESLDLLESLISGTHSIKALDLNMFADPTRPIIFVVEDESLLTEFCQSSGEYRAKGAMRIGKEISKIAVETEEDKLTVQSYLEKFGLDCQLLLFDHLRQANATCVSSCE